MDAEGRLRRVEGARVAPQGEEPGEPDGRKRAARCSQGSDGASRRGGGRPRGRNMERRWQAVPEGGHDVASGSGHPVRVDDGRARLTWQEGRSGRDPSATTVPRPRTSGNRGERWRPGRSEGRGRCRGVADVSFHDGRPAGPTVLEGPGVVTARAAAPRRPRRAVGGARLHDVGTDPRGFGGNPGLSVHIPEDPANPRFSPRVRPPRWEAPRGPQAAGPAPSGVDGGSPHSASCLVPTRGNPASHPLRGQPRRGCSLFGPRRPCDRRAGMDRRPSQAGPERARATARAPRR